MTFPPPFRRLALLGTLATGLTLLPLAAQAPPTPPKADPAADVIGDLPPETVPAAPNPYAVWEERKAMGQAAYKDGRYEAAERFFFDYWLHAWNEDTLCEAATLLVKAMLAQAELKPTKPADAINWLDKIPERLRQLPDAIPNAERALGRLNQARVDYWRGRALLLKGDLQSAETLFNRVVKAGGVSPHYAARGHLGLAEVYLQQKKYADAKREFDAIKSQTVTLEPEEIHRSTSGLIRVLNAQEQWDAAEASFRAQWEKATPGQKTELGMLHLATLVGARKPIQALNFFNKELSKNPDYARQPDHFQTLFVLAGQLSSQSQNKDAIALYKRLQALPTVTDEQTKLLLMRLGDTYGADGQYPEAKVSYHIFMDAYPSDARVDEVRLSLAATHEKANELTEAIAIYDELGGRSEARAETRYTANFRLADLYVGRKNWEQASNAYGMAFRQQVDEDRKAKALFRQAEVHMDQMEDYKKAAELFSHIAVDFPATTYAPDARYKEGLAQEQAYNYADAAVAFDKFTTTWENHPLVAKATRAKANNYQRSGAYDQAIETLKGYVERFGDAPDAAQALLQASSIASASNRDGEAISLLNRIEETYRESPVYPDALYERAYLRLGRTDLQEAGREDSRKFIQLFGKDHPERCIEIYLWLGDHYANLARKDIDAKANFEAAQANFMAIVNNYPKSPEAPSALYEAAKNAYFQRKTSQAIAFLDRLDREYPDSSTRVKASALYLRGDIHSLESKFSEAAEDFRRVTEISPHNTIGWAAYSRRAECLASLAHGEERQDVSRKLYEQALADYEVIFSTPGLDSSALIALSMKSRWGAGRIYEDLGQLEDAKRQYQTVFNYYQAWRSAHPDDHYLLFARAGYSLARVYLAMENPRSAMYVYQAIADAEIPVSGDARAKADAIAAKFNKPAGADSAAVPPGNDN